MTKKIGKILLGSVLGGALCFNPTVAIAATAPRAPVASMSISPFVALSAFSTIQSSSAVCTTAVGAAGVTAAAGQAAPGCVLPVADPVAPAVAEAAPAAAVPAEAVPVAAGFGLGIGALLAGLVAVAGIAAVVLSDNDDGTLPIGGLIPISPS